MARTSDTPDIELIDRLTDVFRRHGFEGASLTRISEATGLKRASLYHRFPGGKAEMAEAVLSRADEWLGTHALSPLQGRGEPADRLRIMTGALSEFYGDGKHSCLLDAFSLGGENTDIRKHVRASTVAWTDALAAVAHLPIAAFLFNCTAPEAITSGLKELSALTDQPRGAYPNRIHIPVGWTLDNEVATQVRTELGVDEFVDYARTWIADGASLIGGCCGIGPEFIRALSASLQTV